MARADTTRSKGRGALIAALVALAVDIAMPLLPIYGGGDRFFWDTVAASVAGRLTAQFLVEQWASAIAVLVGIVMLRRQRSGVAAGAFTAIAIVVIGDLAALLIPGFDVLNTTAGVVLVSLNAVEAAALSVAASIATRRWS
jgi:hypothetical protein